MQTIYEPVFSFDQEVGGGKTYESQTIAFTLPVPELGVHTAQSATTRSAHAKYSPSDHKPAVGALGNWQQHFQRFAAPTTSSHMKGQNCWPAPTEPQTSSWPATQASTPQFGKPRLVVQVFAQTLLISAQY
jgi:hypothetical protein